MINSIDALIIYRGNNVRSGIAQPKTVLRYLDRMARTRNLADYVIAYYYQRTVYRVPAPTFVDTWREAAATFQTKFQY